MEGLGSGIWGFGFKVVVFPQSVPDGSVIWLARIFSGVLVALTEP